MRLLLTILQIVQVYSLDLVLLHNNDIHGRFEETTRNSGTCKNLTPRTGSEENGCVGGFARTAHIIRKYRKWTESGGNPVLYLNAGDTYVGTPWFAVHKWNISAEFMNALQPDAASLGNHEFDFGVASLAPFIEQVTFPIVAANLDFTNEPSLSRINKSVILDVRGTKVGIVGHLLPQTQEMSSPGKVIFNDVITSLRSETEALDQMGVKIIIILGHSGYGLDKKIAAEVPLADVVIGGHTNTFLWNGQQPDIEKPTDGYPTVVQQASGKKVPVVQAYAYTKYLGVLNVTFDEDGNLVHFQGQPVFLSTEVPQDEDFLDLLEKYRPEIANLDKDVVGKSTVLLDATANKCRHKECNLGNLIADSFVYYIASMHVGPGWTDTPIGLINGGSIRTTINPPSHGGNITRGELMGTLPFDNQIYKFRLKGSELIETLEIGARNNGETSSGEFLQSSGLYVVYDFTRPSLQRVVSVKVRCGNCSIPNYDEVNPDEYYGIVTVSFLTGGGDGHHVLQNAPNKEMQDLGDIDTVCWYLQRYSPVYPEEQGRIQFLQKREEDSSSSSRRRTLGWITLAIIVLIQTLSDINNVT